MIPPPAYHATARVNFPTWGNNTLNDCAEAAIADAEIVLGHTPSWSRIADFFIANPYPTPMEEIVSRWVGSEDDPLPSATKGEVERAVYANRVVVAVASWPWGDGGENGSLTPWAAQQHTGPVIDHAFDIDGYNRRGLWAVTYGRTVFMSWQAWDENGIATYAIGGGR